MRLKLLRVSRLVAAGPLLAACTVGPDFQKPPAPAATAYTKAPVAAPGLAMRGTIFPPIGGPFSTPRRLIP